MASEYSSVELPDELVQMFHLARNAFVYYEAETKTWDEDSLIRFRDVLFDLVQAAEADSPEAQQRYVGAAMEHLSLTVSEPLHRRTEEILAEISRPIKLLKVFRLTHKYEQDVTSANITQMKRRIDYLLAEGRKNKANLTLEGAEGAFDLFKQAYKTALSLQETLGTRKLKLPVSLLLWLVSVTIAGFIGAAIRAYLA